MIPTKSEFDMQVALPDDYIGKKVHVLFYIDDEVKETVASISNKQKPFDFFNTLRKQEPEKMHIYITNGRDE